MRRFIAFLLLLMTFALGAHAQSANTPGFTVNSFDGQYLYYNDNQGVLHRRAVSPIQSNGAPTLNPVNCNSFDMLVDVTTNILYYCNAAQTWTQIAGTGGGANPGAPVTSLQCNGGGTPAILVSCNATDTGGTFTINDSLVAAAPFSAQSTASITGAFSTASTATIAGLLTAKGDEVLCGPNTYVDVRCYGVRMVTSAPSTTATISSGSAQATLASGTGFQTGDGITIYGAGANNPVSTPSAPTVAPSLSTSSLRVGDVVSANAGATSYAYCIACRDKAGALTAASSNGTTTTGLANLGAVSVNVTSVTRTNNSVAVVTSSANDLVVGSAVYLQGITDTSFNGPHLVATRTDSTHFTYNQAISTALGATSSSTGGTATWYTSNHITFTLPTNAWECAVYGRTSGSLTFLGMSKPLETFFDDYGSTVVFNGESIMGTPYTPSYIPSTPPVSATNDPLVTTIVAGGGTTTLTLANAATNSVSGATALFDDGVTLKAAVTAAGSEPVYIPSSGGSLVVNSYTVLPGPATLWQAGQMTLNETLELGGSSTWLGDMGGSSATTIQFSWNQSRTVLTNAQPGVYLPIAGTRARGLAFNSTFDQALNVLAEGGFESAFEFCQFETGANNLNFDALGIGYEERGAVNTTFYYTLFNSFFNNSSGPLGLWAPSLLHTGNASGPGGYLNLHNTMLFPKGITFDLSNGTSTNDGSIDQIYSQGLRTPMLTFSQNFGGGLASNWKITNVEEDTSFAPLIANLSLSLNTIEVRNIGGSSGPLLSGNPVTNLTSNGQSLQPYLGGIGSSVFDDAKMTVYGPGTFQSGMLITQTAPGLSVSSGGSLSVGAHTYVVQFLDINGNGSALTPVGSATTTTGNQTITVTPAAFPSGAITWIIYRDGAPIEFPSCGQAPIAVSTTSLVDNGLGSCGNFSLAVNAGNSIVGPLGVSTPTLSLVNNGFTSAFDFPASLTANRNLHVPNATGTLDLLELAQTISAVKTFSAKPIFNAAQTTTFIDIPTQTSPGNPASGNIRVYGDSSSGNLTCLTSSGANCNPSGGGGGTPGGSNTQVQYNCSGAFCGSANLTWVSPALSLGAASSATGQLKFVGTTSGTVTVQSLDAAGTWTFKWPNSAGSANQALTTDGSGNSSWAVLTVPGGGTGATTFTTNALLSGNGTSAINSVAGSTVGTSPILKLQPALATSVDLTLDTAASPTADIMDVNINGTKTSWIDSAAIWHMPQTTYTGTGAFAASGTEGTCTSPVSGSDIICLGDSVTHTARLSNNGLNLKAIVDSANDNPTAHGVAIWGTQFPQIGSTGAGTSGQPLCSQGSTSDPIYCNIGVAVGGTGATTFTAHSVLLGEGTAAVSSVGPSATANLPLINQVGADPIYGALPLSDTTTSGLLPIDRGGTGCSTFAACNLVTVSGAITTNDCVKWTGTTTITDAGAPCGGSGGAARLDQITAATTTATINSTTNPIIWEWGLTGTTTGFKIGEPSAATGSGNILFQVSTLSSSTAIPFQADNNGNGVALSSVGVLASIGTGSITANKLNQALNTTSPITGGGTQTSALTIACATCVTSAASLANNGVVFGSGGAQGTQANSNLTANSSGVLTTVDGVTTAGVGTVFVMGVSNVTAQSASQSAVTLATSPTAGSYGIRYYASQNGTCTTGANSVSFTFNWTDAGNARSATTGSLLLGSAQSTSGYLSGIIAPIFVNSGNVTYTSTVSGSCATGTSSYDIHASLERTQ